MLKYVILFIGINAILFKATISIVIKELSVPTEYILKPGDDLEPIILDCEYDLGENETGFVLKWHLNNVNIYQWIPMKGNGIAMDFMKNRVDLNYIASPEVNHKYRALAIIKPTYNMTGTVTCSAQTFQGTDKRTAELKVIVPETDFQVNYSVLKDDMVNIECNVVGVSPRPILTMSTSEDTAIQQQQIVVHRDDGLFDANTTTIVEKQSLSSPTSVTCVLSIPNTTYVSRKTTVYYDETTPTTTTGEVDYADTGDISQFNSTSTTQNDFSSSYKPIVSALALLGPVLVLLVANSDL